MDNRIKQYLFDIEEAISDVKTYISAINSFNEFEEDKLIRRAVEREIEIIGEAMNRILKIDSSIKISNARSIVSIRNKIIHGYDEVDNVVRGCLKILRTDFQRFVVLAKESISSLAG